MYVCSCFGITEEQVRQHADSGACSPRRIASLCRAGTDCGGCVRRIQALLGRGAYGPARGLGERSAPVALDAGTVTPAESVDGAPVPAAPSVF
ncbi:(2Fe-2S)-binding protein [Streptomyces sp. TP-A0874]|uniref:(2Fe-2S)-binding protein n=1 Tax=Streptomyces sp. TP-A0874 TaxID=549819 RepID=UPI000852F7B8|nr:(2Fe-2S)-binding protein [Streptomyces sp. TP-A0874]